MPVESLGIGGTNDGSETRAHAEYGWDRVLYAYGAGSPDPAQAAAYVIDKVLRYHERFGHEVIHLHADADGLTDKQHRQTLELFQAEIAPVLRRAAPSRPFPQPPVV